jgi:hypothetical protein
VYIYRLKEENEQLKYEIELLKAENEGCNLQLEVCRNIIEELQRFNEVPMEGVEEGDIGIKQAWGVKEGMVYKQCFWI